MLVTQRFGTVKNLVMVEDKLHYVVLQEVLVRTYRYIRCPITGKFTRGTILCIVRHPIIAGAIEKAYMPRFFLHE